MSNKTNRPVCEECDEEMHLGTLPDGTDTWGCDSCGWSFDVDTTQLSTGQSDKNKSEVQKIESEKREYLKQTNRSVGHGHKELVKTNSMEKRLKEAERKIEALERRLWPERFCEHKWEYGLVPCPDGRRGCAVAHYGYICRECGINSNHYDIKEVGLC